MSEPVLVLGVHRSGTSSVAGVLTMLGGGAPMSLMPAHHTNTRGFFESTAMAAFNDELLASAGSSWDDWRRFNPSWFGSVEADAFRRRGVELVEAEFGTSSLPILKDPRICRFAPFWINLFKERGTEPRIVIPIRSPLEVAQSLHQREGHRLPISKGLLLWLRHVLDAEAFSRGEKRSIFSWDQFLTDWRGTVEKIGVDAEIAWPRLSDRAGREIERFVGRELVHHRVAADELVGHSQVHEWTVAAYGALLELARNPFSNSAIEKLNELRGLFDSVCALFGPALVDYEIDAEEFEARRASFSSERDMLSTQANDLAAALAAAREEAAALAGEKDKLAAQRAELEAALAAAREEAAALSGEKDKLAARVADFDAVFRAERGEAAARLADLTGRLQEAIAVQTAAEADRERLALALTRADAEANRFSVELGRVGAEKRGLEDVVAEQQMHLAAAALARAEALSAREELEAKLLEAVRQGDENAARVASLQAAKIETDQDLRKLTEQLQAATVERERRASAAKAADDARQRAEKAAATQEGALRAAHASELAASDNRAKMQIRVLSGQLVEAEARLAKAMRGPTKSSPWERLLPGRRSEARLLHQSGLFEEKWYKTQYPEVALNGRSSVEHFLEEGYLRGYKPNPFFDPRWYLERYEDVRRSGVNPVVHYHQHGFHEHRDPGPEFSTEFYLLANPDVREAGINPLAHYLRHGRYEGRRAVPE